MEDIHSISTTILKEISSPLTTNPQQQIINSTAPLIQQSDVSSSRPALLAHDALGPLLFEALDGFFFTINHNCELDFVSDNVGQYLKFTQEELAGRNLYNCVHPSDVGEFSKAWAKKDAGDLSSSTANSDQSTSSSRGLTFLCRMRANDDSAPYVPMIVSVALHRDTSGSEKTFLICIARRPPVNELKDKPALLGFDQFSSRINLQYDIESLDSSHMKCETLDMNYAGKNFRDYVHISDIPLIDRHFQEVIEKTESKSSIYRFRLHDDIYAFVNTQSKLFSSTNQTDSILSTHTIVRLIDNINDLNGTASTRLMKSIITSNRDLQKNKPSPPPPPPQPQQQMSTNRALPTPSPTATPPIGTQFALTMLGMHKNASNSLQQHVSSTLGTLIQVQNSLSSPNDKSQQQQQMNPPLSPPRTNLQKSLLLDNVSSTDTVEFGSKRTSFSPSLNSIHSQHGTMPSPMNPFDLLFTPISPSNDLATFLPTSSPSTNKTSNSPLSLVDPTALLFSNHDIYTTTSSPQPAPQTPTLPLSNQSRSSTRLRQLLTTKSPSASPSPHYLQDTRPHSNTFDDFIQAAESPTTTHVSPLSNDLPSPNRRRRNHSQTNGGNSADLLLKQILGRHTPLTTTTNTNENLTLENQLSWSSPNSALGIKTESNMSDENAATTPGSTTKLRSDTFLRTLLNDEIRPQKVVVEAPFVYNSRHKSTHRGSGGSNQLLGNSKRNSIKSQLSLPIPGSGNEWDTKSSKKKQRQHSNSLGSRNNSMTTPSTINTTAPRKPGRPKRDPSDYLLSNPQSIFSDNSLDSFFDSTTNTTNEQISSPIRLRRTAKSNIHTNSTVNLKRTSEHDELAQNPRKYPKLLTQALKDEVKVECNDHTIISPSVAIAATRPLNQLVSPIIKTEPEIYDRNHLYEKTPSPSVKRLTNNSNQSTLLRSLIGTPQQQTTTTTAKKDAPLYDLLQTLDSNSTSVFSSLNNTNNIDNNTTNNNSIDPLEQYVTSNVPQSTKSSTKDEYLAALLNSDPQQPKEISFIPTNKPPPLPPPPPPPALARSTSASSDNSRIAAIANDLFTTTTTASIPTTTINTSNDDFLSMLDNRDFLDCINDPSAIDSILSQNSTNLMDTSFSIANTSKRTEKDEKAISEIYKTLVTSFNPGPSSLDLPIDTSPFSLITGDFLFADNSTMSMSQNRTVTNDPSIPIYRQQQQQQQSTNYSYQTPQQNPPSNSAQFTDCLSLDMLDTNSFPPNVSLSPMNNSFLPSTSSHPQDSNSMIIYPQQTATHVQHHRNPNSFYRQTSQMQQQQPMYNSFVQPQPPPPPNQVAPGYYQMPQQSPNSQRIPPANHHAQLNKRQTVMHQQQQQQRTAQQNNQQLQLHMSMNVTLPNMPQNSQQQSPQQQQQQQQQHRQMMNTYDNMMMPNGPAPTMQQDFHQFSPSLSMNNSLDNSYGHDLFMSPSPTGPQNQPVLPQNRHINIMQTQQQQQSSSHQPYNNMNVALSATIQQNSHNSNNLMNSAECRQSEELTNQMMNCLSYPPARCTSEFVRKQLQSTIHGRQKTTGGKDASTVVTQKMMNPLNIDSSQKGVYFRNQLSSQMSTPPLQTNIRSQQSIPPSSQQQQQQQQPNKTSM